MTNDDSRIGAAILGLFAAINICRKEGYDVYAVLKMVEKQCEAWGVLVEDKQ